jgi:short-subunit dehydrogenase
MDLKGQTILITGASRGLGRALSLKLAATGAHLALVARNRPDLDRVVEEVHKLGGSAAAFPCDIAQAERVFNLVVEIQRNLGEPSVLVNCAGLGRYNPLELLTPGEIEAMIEVNLKGTILVTQAVYQRMRMKSRGLIVNVLSTAGREGKARETAYCATKWGVMGFSKALALEARKYGIRVTAFCPGGMDTPFWDHEPEDRKPNRTRFLHPDLVAESILGILALPENVEVPEFALRGVG